MKNSYKDAFWILVIDRVWEIFWSVIRVFLISATIPAGVLFGLRLLRAIRPVVAP